MTDDRMRRLMAGTKGSVLAGLSGQAALVISGPFNARLLGASGRGEFALLTLTGIICSQLAGQGAPNAVAYFVASRRLNAWSVLNALRAHLLRLTIASGALAAVFILVFQAGRHTLENPGADVAAVAVSAMLSFAWAVCLAGLQGQQVFAEFNLLRPLPAWGYSISTIVLFLLDLRPQAYVLFLIAAASVGLAVALSLPLLHRHQPPSHGDELPTSAEVSRFGRRALVSSAWPIDSSFDQLITAAYLSPYALGLYVVAASLSNLQGLVLNGVGLIAGTRCAAAASRKEAWHIARETTRRAVLIGLALTALLEAAVRPLVTTLFGAEFTPAVGTAHLMVLAGMLTGMRRCLAPLLVGVDRPSDASAAEGIGLVCLVVTALIAVPTLGIRGGALALAIGGGVGSLLMAGALLRWHRRSLESGELAADKPPRGTF